MSMTNRTVVVGVFSDPTHAERAVEELHRIGFHDDEIGFVRAGEDGKTVEGERGTGSQAGEGLAKGAVIGGILGAAAALLIPGIGPVIAGGILAPLLGAGATAAGVGVAGAAVGAAAGGLVGALTGLGVPEEEAEYYQGEVEHGRTLVTVRADGRYDEVRSILHRFGAYDIHDRGTTATDTMATDTTTTDTRTTPRTARTTETDTTRTSTSQRMPLREERLDVSKRTEQAGEVRIGKDVVEEKREMDVPVTREEVYVEQHPVDRPLAPGEKAFEGETIRVPLVKEEVDVEKKAQVYGEVEIGKRQVTEQQRVSETLRREEPAIERTGDASTRRTWNDVMPEWRTRWQRQYGSQGGRWEDVAPYYEWGYSQYNDPRYQGRNYNQIEPQLRTDWERLHPETPWDRVRNFVRDLWNRGPGSVAA